MCVPPSRNNTYKQKGIRFQLAQQPPKETKNPIYCHLHKHLHGSSFEYTCRSELLTHDVEYYVNKQIPDFERVRFC